MKALNIITGQFEDIGDSVDTQSPLQKAAADKANENAPILQTISSIESKKIRALSDIALGVAGGLTRLQALESSIATERGKLK